MRIAAGGISHETSTLAKKPTTFRDFEEGLGLYRGEEVVRRFRGANMCIGGFIDGAEQQGFELVPLLWCFAYPSGLIVRSAYEALSAEFLDRLQQAQAAGPIDGVLLDLHGAMVIEGIEDGDGDFIARVRAAVGPDLPIIVTQDLHGNHTRRRVEVANAIVGFDTYPHVDMGDRGREAAALMARTVRGEVKPVMAIHQLPLLWSAPCQITAHPPMDEVLRRLHELETRPGILSAMVSTGFPWADVPEMGSSVIVVADRDRALAQAAADELAGWIWDHRERWVAPPRTVRSGIAEGERLGKYPIILADHADNTGGGAPGDSTEVLQTMIDLNLQDAVVFYIVDPEVVEAAHAAGVGGKIALPLGGKSDPIQGPPVDFHGEVLALSDGKFKYDGPMYAGLTGDLGRSAWVRQGGVSAVVVTARMQPLDQAFARSLGIDCAKLRYISVKSAVHFRSGFERIAGSIHNVDARGIHTHDFKQLPMKRKTRAMYPRDFA